MTRENVRISRREQWREGFLCDWGSENPRQNSARLSDILRGRDEGRQCETPRWACKRVQCKKMHPVECKHGERRRNWWEDSSRPKAKTCVWLSTFFKFSSAGDGWLFGDGAASPPSCCCSQCCRRRCCSPGSWPGRCVAPSAPGSCCPATPAASAGCCGTAAAPAGCFPGAAPAPPAGSPVSGSSTPFAADQAGRHAGNKERKERVEVPDIFGYKCSTWKKTSSALLDSPAVWAAVILSASGTHWHSALQPWGSPVPAEIITVVINIIMFHHHHPKPPRRSQRSARSWDTSLCLDCLSHSCSSPPPWPSEPPPAPLLFCSALTFGSWWLSSGHSRTPALSPATQTATPSRQTPGGKALQTATDWLTEWLTDTRLWSLSASSW